jgi:hypothetical protein
MRTLLIVLSLLSSVPTVAYAGQIVCDGSKCVYCENFGGVTSCW